jgi:nitrogen fixation NifU-like protein
MINELRELYQEVILDHNKAPRNFGGLEPHTHQAEGDNPLCGDHLTLYVNVDGDRISEIKFEGDGCAISKASASLMTEALTGKTIEEAKTLFHEVHDLVTDQNKTPDLDSLGKLAVLSGVNEFPLRVKCATLAWHTMLNALNESSERAKTE